MSVSKELANKINEYMVSDGFSPIPIGSLEWRQPLLDYIDWLHTNVKRLPHKEIEKIHE